MSDLGQETNFWYIKMYLNIQNGLLFLYNRKGHELVTTSLDKFTDSSVQLDQSAFEAPIITFSGCRQMIKDVKTKR